MKLRREKGVFIITEDGKEMFFNTLDEAFVFLY